MKIGLVTTLNTNIGDDFIREGVCHVLKQVLGSVELEFISVNKHRPYSVYPKWHPTHWVAATRHLPRGRYFLRRVLSRYGARVGLSRFDNCNLIVQCGTPVAWPGCSKSEWAEPLWTHVVGRHSRKGTPVLNLGAGACYPWEKQPETIEDENDACYLRRIVSY